MAYGEIGRFFSLALISARMRTHIESRIQIIGLDLMRSRPGVRFAPSGLRTVLDERSVVARMEPAGRANARAVGAIRGARIDGGVGKAGGLPITTPGHNARLQYVAGL